MNIFDKLRIRENRRAEVREFILCGICAVAIGLMIGAII